MSTSNDYEDPLDGFFRGIVEELGAPLLPAGAMFRGFVVLSKRGEGGQGEVYAAWDARHGRFVALKVLLPQGEAPPPRFAESAADLPTQPHHFTGQGPVPFASPGRDVAQPHTLHHGGVGAVTPPESLAVANPLMVEARRAAALGLPHVITVYGFRNDAVLPFLEMEYASGGKLSDWNTECRANPRLLADWLIPVARNLELAHRADLIHRDLKPDNLLLVHPTPVVLPKDGSGPPLPDPKTLLPDRLTCKMADFGLAGPSGAGSAGGTPGYAPPEQWDGQVGPTTDVFALGATMYFLLTGVAPGPQPGRRYVPPDGSALADADRDLRAIVLRALHAEPRARYPSAAALADDLERWRRGDPIQSTPVLRRVKLWVRKQPPATRAMLATAMVLLAVAAGLGGWVVLATERAGREALATAEAREKEAVAKTTLAEQEQKAAHTQRVAAARALAAAGSWREALPQYSDLIADPLTDPAECLRLRVEALPGLLAVHRLDDFNRESAELAGRADLGPLAAPVRLYEAERQLWRRSSEAQGRATLAAALQVFHHPPPADRPAGWDGDAAYAEALAADAPNRMVDLLKKTLALAPYHYPARRTLIVNLVAQGRFRHKETPWETVGEIEEHVDFAARHFPESPVTGFATELMRVLQGEPEPDMTRLAIAAGLERRDRAQLKRLFEEVAACRATIADIRPVRDSKPAQLAPQTADMAAFFKEVSKIKWVVAGGVVLTGLGDSLFPQLGVPYLAFAPIPEKFLALDHYTAVWTGGPKEMRGAIESLELVHVRHPEALLLYFVAGLRVKLTCDLLNAGQEAEALRELPRITDAVGRADRAPTVAPASPFAYRAQVSAALAAGLMLRFDPDATVSTRDRLLETVEHLIKQGRVFPKVRPEVVRLALATLGGRPSVMEEKAWGLGTEEGRARYRIRKRLLLDSVGRPLLNDWAAENQTAGVGDTEPRRLLEQIEAWSKE